ncbi:MULTISPECIES: restriction endonuclease subunit S [Paraburkholderia]|uniref:restriction endonuclease subunit S n=1 Tax=Paraburkholderia TaxID=1822464 RepID=UPI00225A60F0|nr:MULTISPECIES: restriction endonuclease subunit S [Paraburkholderia]MCX4177668.1 restriction endonuclease subunit S [Paraburkholderia madseniana]MDQ6465657.1 restriction endonuclease subunit S [Paraburkholderia madseniana]
MSETSCIALSEIMATKAGSVDPAKFPDEVFDLYSIPAFDKGQPEVVAGSSIGSAKQIVRPGDVLLSKIVPHIRRSWVVGSDKGRRLIASGEWIVFRSERINAAYLRHVLVSNPFHAQFMQTVSGVGGSLLRARPTEVAKIPVPLPRLAEQRRIAAILDHADTLRARRREALRQLDSLTQAIFIDMFGDSSNNRTGVRCVRLSEVTSRITDGTHLTPKFISAGVPFIFVKNFKNGQIDFRTDKFISEEEHAALYRRCPVEQGDVLYTTVGATYGQAVAIGTFTKFAFQRHVAHLKPDARKVLPEFLAVVMQLPFVKRQADRWARGAAQPTINLTELRQFEIPLPTIPMQREFANRVAVVDKLKAAYKVSIAELDELFASLQHLAFRGAL